MDWCVALLTAAVVAGVGAVSVKAWELISSLEDLFTRALASTSLAGVPVAFVIWAVRVSSLRIVSP